MRKLWIIAILACALYGESTDSMESLESADSTNPTESTHLDSVNSTHAEFSPSFLTPSALSGNLYASFAIGYETLFRGTNQARNSGAFFALDIGWNLANDTLLAGFALDGTAGNLYALNLNIKLAAKVFDGRLISGVSLGYGLLHHYVGETQYNLHGANATAGVFVDIARGFGLEIAYRVGLHPYRATKRSANVRVGKIQAVMVNFRFMDFHF